MLYSSCIFSYEVISLLPVLSEKHIYILFLSLHYIKITIDILKTRNNFMNMPMNEIDKELVHSNKIKVDYKEITII